MSTIKIEAPAVGDYVCIYLEHGWVQIKREGEGVVIDVFDHKDELFTTRAVFDSDLEPEEGS